MHNDIEQLINDNLSLRKSYHLAKSHSELLQTQLNELKIKYRDLNDTYFAVTQQNSKLIEKNNSLQAHLANNTASFVSQIEELKSLIQQKENQLENFQLKMIPSLDQDMVRVKLIAEMEGPYQEIVDKKDREITRLKDQIHQLKREKQMAEFSLTNRERDFKKQTEELKNFYDHEIDRLTRQLTHFNQKSNTGKMDKDIIKAYRLQIDQLKSSCQFHRNTEEQLRKQLGTLRFEREKLLADLSNANAQKAIQFKEAYNDSNLKELKFAKARLEDQLQVSQRQHERSKSKIKALEDQRAKLVQKYEWDMREKNSAWQQQRQKHKNEIDDFKDQIRKLRQTIHRTQQQLSDLSIKHSQSTQKNQNLSQQLSSLRLQLSLNESQQISKYKKEDIDRITREKIEREVVEKMERDLRIRIREEIQGEDRKRRGEFQELYRMVVGKVDKEVFQGVMRELKKKVREEIQEEMKRHGESPKREHEFATNKSDKQKIKILDEKLRKLTQKLEFANRKILQLLKQKAQRSGIGHMDLHRTRAHSYSPQHDYNRLLLENRDCSFVPMCPPVIVEQL